MNVFLLIAIVAVTLQVVAVILGVFAANVAGRKGLTTLRKVEWVLVVVNLASIVLIIVPPMLEAPIWSRTMLLLAPLLIVTGIVLAIVAFAKNGVGARP